MFYITYHAKPNKTSKDYDNLGGAHINCWIEEKSSKNADLIARREIEFIDWSVKSIDEIVEVNIDSYTENDSKKEFFEQALIDKIVLLFHTYPKK
jgi:hypothetical protein